MRLIVQGCVRCGTLTESVDGQCEECRLLFAGLAMRKATERVRKQRAS